MRSSDREYLNYLVKESPEGRECDTRSESEILAAVSLLAALHRDMKQVPGFERKDVERLAGIDYHYQEQSNQFK